MKITPVAKRILLATAGIATTAAGFDTINLEVALMLLGAFLTGVAAYNVNGKVTAP
jgi:hypothetical protein